MKRQGATVPLPLWGQGSSISGGDWHGIFGAAHGLSGRFGSYLDLGPHSKDSQTEGA